MPSLGNTLTTQIPGYPAVTTTRNTGESDHDFIDRHCRAVLAAIDGHGIQKLTCVELGVELARESGWSDTEYSAHYRDALEAAA